MAHLVLYQRVTRIGDKKLFDSEFFISFFFTDCSNLETVSLLIYGTNIYLLQRLSSRRLHNVKTTESGRR